MTMTAKQRMVSGVVIIELSGRITLGEGAVILRDTIRDILQTGQKKILLNLADVTYIDSSGIGELVSGFTSARNQGGEIKILGMTKKVHDLLQITKLYTIFDIRDDEIAAIDSFSISIYCKCPSCGSRCVPPALPGLWMKWPEQTCPMCHARFTARKAEQDNQKIVMNNLRIQTYADESFKITSGSPYTVHLSGRLTLFSSAAFASIWRAIPKPRRVIFDLAETTSMDVPGWEALLQFVEKRDQDDKVSISLEDLKQSLGNDFRIPSSIVYKKRKAALKALGNVSDTPEWLGDTHTESHPD